MKPKEIVTILFALAVVVVFGLYTNTHKRIVVPITAATNTIKEESAKPPYTISVAYPVFSGISQPAVQSNVNTAIAAIAQDTVKSFKEQIKEIIIYPDEPNSRSELGVKYEIVTATSTLLSMLFDTYTYSAGAAHPNGYFQSFNYDLARNREIKLGDLFKSNSDYLSAISDFCIHALNEKFQDTRPGSEDWVTSGAAPTEENFEVFSITQDGLKIIFNPYQVGPYAIGPQNVIIPYAELRDVIDPQGPLSPYLP